MNDKNNESLIQFAKAVGFGLACFIALITTAGVWNAVALSAISGFYGWVGSFNVIMEGFGLYSLYKKMFPKKEEKK